MTLYDKLKEANQQLDKAQEVFEDVGDALIEKDIIQQPVKAQHFAGAIRNASIGAKDYNELENKPTIGNVVIQGDIKKAVQETARQTAEEVVDSKDFAKQEDIPTRTSELDNDSGYITASEIPEVDSTKIVSEDGSKQILGSGEVQVKKDGEWQKKGDLLTTADSEGFVKYADEDHAIVDLPSLVRLPNTDGQNIIRLSESSFISNYTMSLIDRDAYVNLGGNLHNAFLQLGPNLAIDAFTEKGRTRIWIDGQVVVGTPVGTKAGQTLRAVSVEDAPAASLMDASPDAAPKASPRSSSHIEWQAVDWPESNPYKIKNVEPTIESDAANVHLQNFTVSVVSISSSMPLVVHLPAMPTDDTARDCVLRLNCTVLPSQVSFVCDGEEVQFESDDDDWQAIAIGSNIISFSETQRG